MGKGTGRVQKVVAAAVMLGALVAVSAAVAGGSSASASPHEATFSTTTDSCAVCHRTHTARAPKLLSANRDALCMACHDGTGANTNVISGVYMGTANGAAGAGLRGGGFSQALMNTDLSPDFVEVGAPAPTTSKHTLPSTPAVSWGSGPAGSSHAGRF